MLKVCIVPTEEIFTIGGAASQVATRIWQGAVDGPLPPVEVELYVAAICPKNAQDPEQAARFDGVMRVLAPELMRTKDVAELTRPINYEHLLKKYMKHVYEFNATAYASLAGTPTFTDAEATKLWSMEQAISKEIASR